MNNTATQTQAQERISTQAGVDAITRGSIAVMGSASALIGIWALGCIITAAFTAGPLALAQGWITAVTGL